MPPSILELNDNLTTLVDTSKLISIINRLIKKKWFFLSGGSPEKKAGNLNHEQAALRVLSINSIYCPQKTTRIFGAMEKAQKYSSNKFCEFFGATEKSLKKFKGSLREPSLQHQERTKKLVH